MGRPNQGSKLLILVLLCWIDLDVAHEPSVAFKQASWIGKRCAKEEADVHVFCEGVDVAQSHAPNTDSRVPVVQKLLYVFTAGVPLVEPQPGKGSRLRRRRGEPLLNSGVLTSRAFKREESDFWHGETGDCGLCGLTFELSGRHRMAVRSGE